MLAGKPRHQGVGQRILPQLFVAPPAGALARTGQAHARLAAGAARVGAGLVPATPLGAISTAKTARPCTISLTGRAIAFDPLDVQSIPRAT